MELTQTDYLNRAEHVLKLIEQACDRLNETTDADVDAIRNGSMLSLVFTPGGEIVVNLQKPLQEIWLAARSGGYHFKWADGDWQDTKGGGEFVSILQREVQAQWGFALSLSR